jgi:hypothetical protein
VTDWNSFLREFGPKPAHLPKKRWLQKHASERASERYSKVLAPSDLKGIGRKIQAGKSTFVERRTRRVTVHDVEHNGELYRVMYDSKRNCVVTFIPVEP